MTDTMQAWLERVYAEANGAELLQAQEHRFRDALDQFESLYGPGPVHLYRAPGRVNLIGEHTDYNHGYVLPIALDKDIVILARPRDDVSVVLHNIESREFGRRSFTMSSQIPAGTVGDWGNYAKGAAQALMGRFGPAARGMDALVVGRSPFGVPIGAGLSSSSALTVVMAIALIHLNDWSLSPVELAHLCAEAEWYVGTRGGIMDHFISVLGRCHHALFLDCRPDPSVEGDFRTAWVPIPAGYSFAVVDSGKRRETAHSRFNVRVAECKIAVELLRRRHPEITHLRDMSCDVLGLSVTDLQLLLQEELPERADAIALTRAGVSEHFLTDLISDHRLAGDQEFRVRARARHVVTENQRVLDGIAALGAGQAERFGCLMAEAHLSMSRDYDASCEELDILVSLLQDSDDVLGARVTGAGWGGCAVALLRDGCHTELERRVAGPYLEKTGLALRVFPCRALGGAGPIGGMSIT